MEPRGHSRIPVRNPVDIPGGRNEQFSTKEYPVFAFV